MKNQSIEKKKIGENCKETVVILDLNTDQLK